MNPRILLVDDEAAIRRQLSVAMAQNGYETAESGDGLTALQIIDDRERQGRPFQAVVTDVVLPDIDGLKLLSIIKSRYPQMHVVVISGYTQPETAEEVERRQGDAFVAKPFQMEDLSQVLSGLELDEAAATENAAAAPESVAAYAFIRLAEDADPMGTLARLRYEDSVLCCDAVRGGDWDIVLLLHGDSHKALRDLSRKRIRGIEGVGDLRFMPVSRPRLEPGINRYIEEYDRAHATLSTWGRTPNRATSYVEIEYDPADLAGLYTRLYFLDEVVEIDADAEKSRLLLLVQGPDFGSIRRVIRDRLRFMDGVTRVHELKVVPFEHL